MKDSEILSIINKYIREEHGKYLRIKDKLIDANLDSLGLTMVLLALDGKFGIFKKVTNNDTSKDPFIELDIPNLTIKRLIELCK